MDKVSRETRSRMMSKIKGKDTAPELLVRNYLHKRGFRFRLHYKDLPGEPDVVLKKYKTCIFINGCFWHKPLKGRCGNCRMPKTNKAFWKDKLSANIKRDKSKLKRLEDQGWNFISVWECELQDQQSLKDLSSMLIIKK